MGLHYAKADAAPRGESDGASLHPVQVTFSPQRVPPLSFVHQKPDVNCICAALLSVAVATDEDADVTALSRNQRKEIPYAGI